MRALLLALTLFVPSLAYAQTTVLYRATWDGWDVHLIGASGRDGTAALWLASPTAGRVEIHRIDLARHALVDRWQATEPGLTAYLQHTDRFVPFSSTLEADVDRFAQLLAAAGADHHDMPTLYAGPRGTSLLVRGDTTDGSDADWLFLTDAHGVRLRQFAPGLRAYYEPRFSPDGSRVAFIGCRPTPGDACTYHLYLASLRGPPIRVAAVPQPTNALWETDDVLYAGSRFPRTREHCLYRIDRAHLASPRRLVCVPGFDTTAHMVASPSGETAVLAVPGAAHGGDFTFVWFGLHDAVVRGAHTVPGSVLAPVFLDDHRLWLSGAGDVAYGILDLATGAVAWTSRAQAGGLLFFPTRVTSGEVVAIRQQPGGDPAFELVAVTVP